MRQRLPVRSASANRYTWQDNSTRGKCKIDWVILTRIDETDALSAEMLSVDRHYWRENTFMEVLECEDWFIVKCIYLHLEVSGNIKKFWQST